MEGNEFFIKNWKPTLWGTVHSSKYWDIVWTINEILREQIYLTILASSPPETGRDWIGQYLQQAYKRKPRVYGASEQTFYNWKFYAENVSIERS